MVHWAFENPAGVEPPQHDAQPGYYRATKDEPGNQPPAVLFDIAQGLSPMRPYNCPDQLGEGEVATWAPSSSTLISGPAEGIVIDALLTFDHADEIAARAKGSGKKITGIYITHGHSDHWLGLARLLEHFPEARGYAAPEVAGRAAWEAEFSKTAKYWASRFPGGTP